MEEIELENGDFEGGWREIGAPELKVADGWEAWWHHTDTRPEYKIATKVVDALRIHEGEQAQQWFNNYATHTAGIYQVVEGVDVGREVILTAFVQCFSRNDDTNWRKSDGRYRMRVGIDPYGGINPESPDIVWSVTMQPYDDYKAISVPTVTRSDRLTVFVWGQAEWAVKHNDAYVDSVELWYADDKEPPPEPPPDPGQGITEARVRELFAEMFPAFYEMNIKQTMQKLAQVIKDRWPV